MTKIHSSGASPQLPEDQHIKGHKGQKPFSLTQTSKSALQKSSVIPEPHKGDIRHWFQMYVGMTFARLDGDSYTAWQMQDSTTRDLYIPISTYSEEALDDFAKIFSNEKFYNMVLGELSTPVEREKKQMYLDRLVNQAKEISEKLQQAKSIVLDSPESYKQYGDIMIKVQELCEYTRINTDKLLS